MSEDATKCGRGAANFGDSARILAISTGFGDSARILAISTGRRDRSDMGGLPCGFPGGNERELLFLPHFLRAQFQAFTILRAYGLSHGRR